MREVQEGVQDIELKSFIKSGVEATCRSLDDDSNHEEDEEDLEIDLRDSNFPWVLASLWNNSALAALDGTIVSTTVNDIASRFQQASMVTWVATAYLLTTTATQPLYGKVSDIIGRRRCLLFAESTFALGVLLCNFSKSIPQLAIARAICGVGGSGNSAMSNIMLSDILPLSERALYWSYGAILVAVFQGIGGPLGGVLLKLFGLHGLFIPQVPFCLGSLYLSYRYVQDYKQDSNGSWRKIDFGGSLCLLVGISSFILFFSANDGVTNLEDSSWPAYKKWSCGLLILSVLSFMMIEKYIAVESVIPISILQGTLGLMVFIQGFVAMVSYTCLFMVPLYLQLVWGVSVSSSGGYIMFIVLSSSLGSMVTSWIIKRVARPTRESTMFCSAGAIFYMSALSLAGYYLMRGAIYNSKPVYGNDTISKEYNWALLFGITLLGACQGSQNVTIMLYNVAKVGRKEQASSTSVNLLFRSLGNVLSVSISFNVFTNCLKKTLGEVLRGKDDMLLMTLLRDNAYLRSEEMPPAQIMPILDAFRKALAKSFVPSEWCLILSFILSTMLFAVVWKRSTTPKFSG
ncbi:uncharacterized protein ZBIST_0773 [Zygosaccharomyces bailii]|nr:uncharacterized protein ZBIST_0773 [Zygosaccharomyces bailii]